MWDCFPSGRLTRGKLGSHTPPRPISRSRCYFTGELISARALPLHSDPVAQRERERERERDLLRLRSIYDAYYHPNPINSGFACNAPPLSHRKCIFIYISDRLRRAVQNAQTANSGGLKCVCLTFFFLPPTHTHTPSGFCGSLFHAKNTGTAEGK